MRIFEICHPITLLIIFGYVRIMNSAELHCYNRSPNNYTIYSLETPEPFLNSTSYQPELKTVFYTFGFIGTANDLSVQRIVGAYYDKANTCLLNWEKEAASGILPFTSYITKAVPNAKLIGKQFGKTLIKLHNAGLNLLNVHLIGYSLGAHLMSYTGKEVQDNENIIGRITGLDPAAALFHDKITLNGLSKSDASFVDVVHTNPGRFGNTKSSGVVDIWVNCGSIVQPSCVDKATTGILSEQDLCSHDLSWFYFAEAVERPAAFEARLAAGCSAWREGRGVNYTIYMGDNTDTGARGDYYLQTNAASPYGRGKEGSRPS